jgi:hypothetical protein
MNQPMIRGGMARGGYGNNAKDRELAFSFETDLYDMMLTKSIFNEFERTLIWR